MKITTRIIGDVYILDCQGQIVYKDGAVKLREMVYEVLKDGGKKLLLNLAKVDFVDSSGIGAMVSSCTVTLDAGGQLKLLNVMKKIQDVLFITKLLPVFKIFDDEQAALDSFKSPGEVT